MQTAKKAVVPFASRAVAPNDLKQCLEGIAADVTVIHWACFGMREVQTDDGLLGLERLTQGIQDDIEAIAEECLAKVQRLGPCLRLIFTVEDPSNWPDYKVLVANLIVPAEEAANIARGILAGPLPQPPKKTELHAVN